jgi:hypothetical protein
MATTMDQQISNPKQIAEKGEEIYKKYQVAYEKEHAGKFVAIDVKSEKLYVAETAVEALQSARAAAPLGLFHLIKVGAPGAFRVSYTANDSVDWLFR